jgi:hypothetical protein
VARELTCESTLKKLGLCLRLHAENPWVPHSRIDLLHALNIDIQNVTEERDCSSTVLMELWDYQCEETENLQLVEINVENVHVILTRCHFTDLVRAVRRNHPTLLETVTAISGQRYESVHTVAIRGATTRIIGSNSTSGLGCSPR